MYFFDFCIFFFFLGSRAVKKHLDKPTSVYLGVDPSASSLHVGNLLALIGLLHFRLKGHSVIALVRHVILPFSSSIPSSFTNLHSLKIGGATGSVGDPSGRSTERNALSTTVLKSNSDSITLQVNNFLTNGLPFAKSRSQPRYSSSNDVVSEKNEGKGDVFVVNNLDWLGGVGLLDFLSKVGKFSRMSTMLARDRYVILSISLSLSPLSLDIKPLTNF